MSELIVGEMDPCCGVGIQFAFDSGCISLFVGHRWDVQHRRQQQLRCAGKLFQAGTVGGEQIGERDRLCRASRSPRCPSTRADGLPPHACRVPVTSSAIDAPPKYNLGSVSKVQVPPVPASRLKDLELLGRRRLHCRFKASATVVRPRKQVDHQRPLCLVGCRPLVSGVGDGIGLSV